MRCIRAMGMLLLLADCSPHAAASPTPSPSLLAKPPAPSGSATTRRSDVQTDCGVETDADDRTVTVARLRGVPGSFSAPARYLGALSRFDALKGYSYTVEDEYPYKLGVRFSLDLVDCVVTGVVCPARGGSQGVVAHYTCEKVHDEILLAPGQVTVPISFRDPGEIRVLAFDFANE